MFMLHLSNVPNLQKFHNKSYLKLQQHLAKIKDMWMVEEPLLCEEKEQEKGVNLKNPCLTKP